MWQSWQIKIELKLNWKLNWKKTNEESKTEQDHKGRSTHKTESRRGWLSNIQNSALKIQTLVSSICTILMYSEYV